MKKIWSAWVEGRKLCGRSFPERRPCSWQGLSKKMSASLDYILSLPPLNLISLIVDHVKYLCADCMYVCVSVCVVCVCVRWESIFLR